MIEFLHISLVNILNPSIRRQLFKNQDTYFSLEHLFEKKKTVLDHNYSDDVLSLSAELTKKS